MKEQLIAHVEKIALGLCVLLMVWFLYSALTTEKYQKKPEDFEKIAAKAREVVGSSKVPLDDLLPPDLKGVVADINREIDPEKVKYEKKWLRPFDFGLNFRKEPTILRPDQPLVQLNRGLIKLFKTDLNGKRIVRPIKAGGAGGARGNANVPPITEADIERMRSQGFEPDEAAFWGNEEIFKMIGGSEEAAAEVEAVPTNEAVINVERFDIRNRRNAGGVAARPVEKAAIPGELKNQPVGEELVVGMIGKEWVEVVAPFPHAEQIREYIKALREPASLVGLRYARAEVERRELDSNHDWTEWKKVPIKEQWEVIQNAVSWEPEPFLNVAVKGLAMHIPELISVDKQLLTAPEFLNPRIAEYTPEELDPSSVPKAAPKAQSRRREAKPKPAVAAKPKVLRDVRPPQAAQGGATFDNRYQVNSAMIRFWDFTILPGRRYQYKIRVVVYNPNFDRLDVASQESSNNKYLEGQWSEPSAEIYIQPSILWFVADKQKSAKVDRVDIEVQVWARDIGEWVTNTFIQRAGEIIGGISAAPTVFVRWNESLGQWERRNEDLTKLYDTGQIILDVSGGQVQEVLEVPGAGSARRSFKLPREIVSVNAFGDLIRRNEDDDRQDPDRLHNAERHEKMVSGGAAEGADVPAGAEPGADDPVDPLAPKKGKFK